MVRTDLHYTPSELFEIMMYEIAHIYCIINEVTDSNFYDKYCCSNNLLDGSINAGYAFWREAVADIMAKSIISEFCSCSLIHVKREVEYYYSLIIPNESISKLAVSKIITKLFDTKELGSNLEWESVD